MFFRRRNTTTTTITSTSSTSNKEGLQEPIIINGNLYVEEGQEYDSDVYETDSDYSDYDDIDDIDNEVDDEEEEEEEEEESINDNDESIDENVDKETDITITKNHTNNNMNVNENKNMISKDNQDKDEHHHQQQQQDDDENTLSQLTTTLHEKRSLLALAAQHDRVDIIKTILQSSYPTDSISTTTPTTTINHNAKHLIQLLLNNKIITTTKDENNNNNNNVKNTLQQVCFGKEHLEKIFLPPLHIAIASSATNAASCLLRMGADPSIRPSIPNTWIGPNWDDPTSNKSYNSSDSTSRNNNHNHHNNNQDVIDYWKKINGLTAWEIAFGYDEDKHHQQQHQQNKDDILYQQSTTKSQGEKKKRSWFSWSSKDTNESMESSGNNNPPFDIAPSKLEGIKHAFTAEALRAIGSDEVNRLRDLLESGLNSTPTSSSVTQSNHNGDRGLEIGGKSLMGWCIEMNAKECTAMLRDMYSSQNENKSSEKKNTDITEKSIDLTTKNTDQTQESNDEESEGGDMTDKDLLDLEIKLEENRVLSASLSLVLDNLAEEVSLTQGLLYQQGDSSNSALISQVRTLKERRTDAEIDISEWEGRLADRIVELRLVLTWWKNKGGSGDDFADIFDGEMSTENSFNDESSSQPIAYHNGNSLKSRIMEARAQVTLSESKVKKLRSSIADLAEENSRNLKQVTELGLGGAVNLARKLKEEVKEKEHILQNLKQREAACRTRVCMIRSHLETLNSDVTIGKESSSIDNVGSTQNKESSSSNHTSASNSDITSEIPNANTVSSDGSKLIYDEEEDCIVEYVDHSDDSDIEYEYYSESDEEKDKETIPNSEVIRNGMSTALARKEEQHEFYSFKLWELLMRMIGLSKQAIKQTAKENGLEEIANITGAMIV